MQGPAVADDSLSANMADEACPHSESADGGFNEHKATIARLYLVEGRTLEDVREIMAETHQFTASPKMYKSRFKKWGWRKNIRFDRPMVLSNDPRFILPIHLSASGSVSMPESAAAAAAATETTYTTTSSSMVPSSHSQSQSQRHRQYPTLEVQQERLESYLRRRQRRDRARLKNGVVSRVQQAPVAIRPPDRFWASQIVLIHVQQHIIRRYTGNLATTDELNDMWAESVEATLFSWDRYTYALAEALETPGRFPDALALLRRAPQELAMMLSSQPIITTSDLCVFIVYLTRPRAYEDAQQKRQFYQVLRSLFKVAAANHLLLDWPPEHPMLRIFQGLSRTDDDDLHQLAKEAWKLGASTMDLFLDNLGPSGAPGLAASAGPSNKPRAPPELICLLDETQRRARAGYGASKPWLLESLYDLPDDLDTVQANQLEPSPVRTYHFMDTTTSSSSSSSSTLLPLPPAPAPAPADDDDWPQPRKSLEQSVDEMVAKILKAFIGYMPHGGGKIVSMKAFFDAHSAYGQHDKVQRLLAEKYLRTCIVAVCEEFGTHDPLVPRYLAELENALRTWGEMEKADGVVRWREELLLGGGGDEGGSQQWGSTPTTTTATPPPPPPSPADLGYGLQVVRRDGKVQGTYFQHAGFVAKKEPS